MKKFDLLVASALALVIAAPAAAKDNPDPDGLSAPAAATAQDSEAPQSTETTDDVAPVYGEIVVTAQRQAERLQDVPIAVSAFSADALEKQQINVSSDLQLTLPNVTFTKTNFTSSSFTIRGIGDLCTGVTCDSATAIHVNDMPLLSSRLFESEFYDLERIEVLRGPQGTLFGRNATSGVVNFITAKPDLSGFHASADAEYGNYNSKKLKGMVNVPLTDTIGVRFAGLYLNRDGFTKNLYDNSRIDGRDIWSVRGTLSWEPDADTRLDLIGYYFHEDDNRSRIQKQLCHRDPTGILGCLPDKLANETTNGVNSLANIFTSREFLQVALGAKSQTLAGLFTPLALGSIYGPDPFAGITNPSDVRTVRLDYSPTYYAEEQHYMAKLFHDFGPVSLTATGGYDTNTVRSRSDYNLAVENSLVGNMGLATLNAYAAAPSPFQPIFAAIKQTLAPNGAAGPFCQSDADPNGVGVFGGNSVGCFNQSLDFDQSSQKVEQWSTEVHLDSHLDGMFNFLLGAIYFDSKTFDNSYYVNAFGLDYASALLGAAQTIGAQSAGATTYPLVFAGTPFYRNNTDYFHLKSYGLFGETYLDFTPKMKLTLGLRYNHDDKYVRARTSLFQDSAGNTVAVPYGSGSITDAVGYAGVDFDAAVPGAQPFAENEVSFDRLTGRAVLDYKITRDNLLYASYSRGYKSGGINPPLSPVFAVPSTFDPEKVDAFEIGSKNSFGHGAMQLNLTGFYYKYHNLQLSRIVSRTSVNDNVNADIYGIEAEAIMHPSRALAINMNASYLHTKVADDKYLADPRDPSGGRPDAVIIKDITNSANCALVPTGGATGAQANAFVATVNGIIGSGNGNPALLRPPTPVPGTNTTGAFSVCSALQGAATYGLAALSTNPAVQAQLAMLQMANFGSTGALPFQMLGSGVPVNIAGNQLPQAPQFKWSVGAQYTAELGGGMTLVPRVDYAYTGESYASIFNRPYDRMEGFAIVNAQVQLSGEDDRWYVRGYVQNLTNNNATTGQYATDQSSGLYTNIFTLEPRRYGVAVGFHF